MGFNNPLMFLMKMYREGGLYYHYTKESIKGMSGNVWNFSFFELINSEKKSFIQNRLLLQFA